MKKMEQYNVFFKFNSKYMLYNICYYNYNIIDIYKQWLITTIIDC